MMRGLSYLMIIPIFNLLSCANPVDKEQQEEFPKFIVNKSLIFVGSEMIGDEQHVHAVSISTIDSFHYQYNYEALNNWKAVEDFSGIFFFNPNDLDSFLLREKMVPAYCFVDSVNNLRLLIKRDTSRILGEGIAQRKKDSVWRRYRASLHNK